LPRWHFHRLNVFWFALLLFIYSFRTGDDARSDADDSEAGSNISGSSSRSDRAAVAPGDEAAAAMAAVGQEASRQKPSAKRLHMILKAALVRRVLSKKKRPVEPNMSLGFPLPTLFV
jgi:hypothetical protein